MTTETSRFRWALPSWSADWQQWQPVFRDLMNNMDATMFANMEGSLLVFRDLPNVEIVDMGGGAYQFRPDGVTRFISRTFQSMVTVSDTYLDLVSDAFICVTFSAGITGPQTADWECIQNGVDIDTSVHPIGYVNSTFQITWFNGAILPIGTQMPLFNIGTSSGGGGGVGGQRKRAVIDIVDCTAAPPTENDGDRYIIDDSGAVNAAWDGASQLDIVQYSAGLDLWIAETPDEGWALYVDAKDDDYRFIDDGSPTWERVGGVVNMDDVYDNFASNPATVVIDGAEGQGDLTFGPTGTYSFNVNVGGVTNVDTDGLRVYNGTDHFSLYRHASNQIALVGVLESIDLAAAAAVDIASGAASSWGVTGANLTFSTTTTGDIAVNAADAANIDATDDSYFKLTANDALDKTLAFESANSGGGEGLISFKDSYLSSAIMLSESGEASFDTASQSIVGAVNELHGEIDSYTFDDCYDNDSGERTIDVDATDSNVSWDLSNANSFIIDLAGLDNVDTDGFQVNNSGDYFRVLRRGTNQIYLHAVLQSVNMLASANGMSLGAVGGQLWFTDAYVTNLKLSEIGHTSLHTTNQTIVSAINELEADKAEILDDCYNNDSGTRLITVDDGDISFAVAGSYSVEVDITNIDNTADGFTVKNGVSQDYFSLLWGAANQINLNAVLEEVGISATSAIDFESVGTSSWTVTSGALEFETQTTGDIKLTSIQGIGLDATEEFTILGALSSSISLTANNAADQTLTIQTSNAGAGDGNLLIDVTGRMDVDVDGGDIEFTWTGLSDCIFDLSNCSNPSEGEATFRIKNGTDYIDATREGDNLLDFEAYIRDFKLYPSNDFTVSATSSFSIAGSALSTVSVTGANLSLKTVTSGDVAIEGAANVSFKDQHQTSAINFSETGEDGLHSNFTASSILGAINETRTEAVTVPIPIDWVEDGGTAPEASILYQGATNGAVRLRKFSGSADNDIEYHWKIPPDCDVSSGIWVNVDGWVTESTVPTTGEGVSFKIKLYSIAQGGNIDQSYGSESESNLDVYAAGATTQGDYFETGLSGNISLSSGKIAMIAIRRDTADTDDDYVQKVGISGFNIKYIRSVESS